MDRPIKFNPSGKYNLNFIDPNNDIAAYYGSDEGVDRDFLESLINEYMETVTYETESEFIPSKPVPKSNISKLQAHEYTKQSRQHQCPICLIGFKNKQTLKQLPCSHLFHEECIRPWFSKNNKCPNCRFDVNQHFGVSG